MGVVKNRRLKPTGFGLALVRAYFDIDKGLVLPEVRANIEKQVSDIANGKAKMDDVLAKSLAIFKEKYDTFVKNAGRLDFHFND